MTHTMNELDRALKLALEQSDGDPQKFAFYLTAPIAAWAHAGDIDRNAGFAAVDLLHRLHPPYC